jgi:outer membrane protein assembly factor BamB
MHRSLGMPVIQDGLLVIGDFAGLVHCLDVKTGQVLWTHDCMSAIWGTPLVAEGRAYIGTQDGDVLVFALAREKKLLAKNRMEHGVHGTAVAAGNVLYIATAAYLFAIAGQPAPGNAGNTDAPPAK